MRECKLRSDANWKDTLKQKGVKQTAVKQWLVVCGMYRDQFVFIFCKLGVECITLLRLFRRAQVQASTRLNSVVPVSTLSCTCLT
jgi:hypothetical protein